MSSELTAYYPPAGTLHYPTDSVLGAVNLDRAVELIDALKALGIADDGIMVLTDDRRDDFSLPVDGGGVRGAVKRALADMGGDLDLLRAVRDELRPDRGLVRADLNGNSYLRSRVADAYWRHGGSNVNYLSQITIETMRQALPD